MPEMILTNEPLMLLFDIYLVITFTLLFLCFFNETDALINTHV